MEFKCGIWCKIPINHELVKWESGHFVQLLKAMTTVISSEALESKLKEQLPNVVFVRATDESNGCGSRFHIEVVSDCFAGKPLLAQHKLVHKALEAESQHIHALTLKTRASL